MGDTNLNFNGPLNFAGGIQNFGGQNTNTQQNTYVEPAALERIETELAALRESFPDPVLAEQEIVVIREGLRQPSPGSRQRVDAALQRLSANAGHARTAVEALAAIGALVAAHWPL
jgi:hypothetical protein